MTKSFEEFEVHKKGVLLTKRIFKLFNNSTALIKECSQQCLEKSPGYKTCPILIF
jgi:hypothetical protein